MQNTHDLKSINRGVNRKASEEQIEAGRQAQVMVDTDFCLELSGVAANVDVLSVIFSFVPANFLRRSTTSQARHVLPKLSCLKLREVCKAFLYCFQHQAPHFWRMPHKLHLGPGGLTGAIYSDGWSRRLLLYRYYRETNEQERRTMMTIKENHQEMMEANSRPFVTAGPVFARCQQMAHDLASVIPNELFNPDCSLKINAHCPEPVICKLLDLSKIGLTVLQCRKIQLELSDAKNRFWFSTRHVSVSGKYGHDAHKELKYTSVPALQMLKHVAPTVHRLRVSSCSNLEFNQVLRSNPDIVFPQLKHLYTDESTSCCYPIPIPHQGV